MTIECFHAIGKTALVMEALKIIVNALINEIGDLRRICSDTKSEPTVGVFFMELITRHTSDVVRRKNLKQS